MNERINELLDSIDVNPKIRELAEQAGCSIDRLGYGEGNLEKFAELIVQECLLAISKTPELFTDEEVATMVKCHTQVEKHFGVE